MSEVYLPKNHLPTPSGSVTNRHFLLCCRILYNLERIHWKTLNTESERCDESESEPNTTICITRYIEQSVGCSMGYHGTDPEKER